MLDFAYFNIIIYDGIFSFFFFKFKQNRRSAKLFALKCTYYIAYSLKDMVALKARLMLRQGMSVTCAAGFE